MSDPVTAVTLAEIFGFFDFRALPCALPRMAGWDLTACAAEQQWLGRSCPRYLGPSLWRSCIQRESGALRAEECIPGTEQFPHGFLPLCEKKGAPTEADAMKWAGSSPRMYLVEGSRWAKLRALSQPFFRNGVRRKMLRKSRV